MSRTPIRLLEEHKRYEPCVNAQAPIDFSKLSYLIIDEDESEPDEPLSYGADPMLILERKQSKF
jgi:hypothetical protein